MAIPPGAVYVSEDGLVTFDQYGRKLDSLGNVAWDDTQGAWGANAKPIERPQQQMQQQPQTQQAATPVVKAATGAYSPSVSATPQQGAAAQQRPPVQAYLPQSFQPWNQPQQQQQQMQRPPQMMQPQPPIPQYWPPQPMPQSNMPVQPPGVEPWSVAPGAPYMPQQQVPYSSAWKPSW